MSGVGDWGFRGKGESERGAKLEGGQRRERGAESGLEGERCEKRERTQRREPRPESFTDGLVVSERRGTRLLTYRVFIINRTAKVAVLVLCPLTPSPASSPKSNI